MMDTAAYQARETIKKEKKNGTLINACGKKSAQTAVFLDNGTVISSPLTIGRLLSAIDKANAKQSNPTRANQTKRLKVYEAIEEAPDSQEDQEFSDFSADLESDSEFAE